MATSASDALLRMCALASACGGDHGLMGSFGMTCSALAIGIDPWGARAASLADCIGPATDCASWRACLPMAVGGATSACDASTVAHCEGDRLVQCGTSGALETADCTTPGEWWFQGNGFAPLPAGACVNGQCAGAGSSCAASPYQSTCQGSVVVGCTAGRTATFDCASLGLGLTCRGGSCTGHVLECDGSARETCTDGVITFCLFGQTTAVDCKKYGFSRCGEYYLPGRLNLDLDTAPYCVP
jgi:hypothetical protein